MMTQEQELAADRVAEAMRGFNSAVREALASGLKVEIELIEMHSTRSPEVPMQLISPRVVILPD